MEEENSERRVSNNKSILVNTGISLISILFMVFYLGAKSNTLDEVAKNNVALTQRVTHIEEVENKRDVETQKILDTLTSIEEDLSSIKHYLNNNYLKFKEAK